MPGFCLTWAFRAGHINNLCTVNMFHKESLPSVSTPLASSSTQVQIKFKVLHNFVFRLLCLTFSIQLILENLSGRVNPDAFTLDRCRCLSELKIGSIRFSVNSSKTRRVREFLDQSFCRTINFLQKPLKKNTPQSGKFSRWIKINPKER